MSSPIKSRRKNGFGISMVLLAALSALGSSNVVFAGSNSKPAAISKAPEPTLDMAPYTGSGKLPVGMALEKLLPTVSAIYLNNNLSMTKVVNWKVVNGTVGQALDEIFHPLQLEWYLSADNSLTITKAAIGSEQIITTIRTDGSSTLVSEKVKAFIDGAPAPSVEAPTPIWYLKEGETIRAELVRWAKESGWSLVWHLDKDWMVPANSEFVGNFDIAAAKVIETLSSNGVLIHASFYTANKTLVITGPGVTPQ
ncbi:toxin co-regulated pilus biosynthesis Q family protein [Polynucleobacter sp. Fuers-14]|uniref:toxin co-regulated pilus biosynthesis Q family protein n=1 Tax=Polynucleobacter sp. Fuers-14 TaxID=1758364 RepID=UPI001C0B2ADB|nr:toxin co-regulated pilus biosynthesis Q family protein [Polynucleobacter sp. Fuers-14]MBU3640978.1 toxin co-regulated pilus biosynthesis Q family protein [Polynucleobacter sp. Fuers-14]